MNIKSIHIIVVLLLIGTGVKAQDLIPPDAPTIDSVTVQWENPVNSNGDIRITWKLSPSPDVRSYYIKYLNEALGTYKFLDSVDANTNTYLDTKAVTNPHYPQTYVVQAVDSSNNTSNHSEDHQTVRVFPWQTEEDCELNVDLSWNPYLGWEEGILYFYLYAIENNTTHFLGRFGPDETHYLYPIDTRVSNYEFYIRVESNNGRTSTSNKIKFTPQIQGKPKFIIAQYASVEDKKVVLKFSLDNTAEIKDYQLMRSEDDSEHFIKIKTFDNVTESILNFTDEDVEVKQHQYFYRLDLINSCGNTIDNSNLLSTILLTGESNQEKHFHYLLWNSYFNYSKHDKNYQLIRNSEVTDEELIYESTLSMHYVDRLMSQDYTSFTDEFCYYISLKNDTTPEAETVKSNIVCLSFPPSVMMPNAFTPNSNSKNRIFKPSLVFISPKNYYFAIYDRWGILIFETNNFNEGWTGRKNGLVYNNGIYSYYLEYYSSKGIRHIKSGTFNLIN